MLKRAHFVCAILLLTSLGMVAHVPVQTARADTAVSSHGSPVGRWKTVDDITGKVKSVVAIREMRGKLYGQIEKVYDPPVPDPRCIQCTGDLKDHPVIGLQVLWGLHKVGNRWTDGHILDPESGNVYRCSIALEDGGTKLRVRGYVGVSLLGRTQHWLRLQ
ncbi:MAG: DUF2147 domain-containing protein [Acidobacteriota bacterium]